LQRPSLLVGKRGPTRQGHSKMISPAKSNKRRKKRNEKSHSIRKSIRKLKIVVLELPTSDQEDRKRVGGGRAQVSPGGGCTNHR